MYHGLTNLTSSARPYCSTPPHLPSVILYVPQYYNLTIPSNTNSDHQLKSSLTSAFLILYFCYHVEYRAFRNLLHLVLRVSKASASASFQLFPAYCPPNSVLFPSCSWFIPLFVP